jgi:hypothetical protein
LNERVEDEVAGEFGACFKKEAEKCGDLDGVRAFREVSKS